MFIQDQLGIDAHVYVSDISDEFGLLLIGKKLIAIQWNKIRECEEISMIIKRNFETKHL